MIDFKRLSSITSAITFILFIILLTLPKIVFILFQIEEADSAFFIARRAAMLFLGFTLITWTGRNSGHSPLRQSVCLGLSTTMLTLAALGIFEFIQGQAGPGILLAVTAELIIGGLYLNIWLKNRFRRGST